MQGTINFNPSFMAGFTLAAHREKDGTLVSDTGAKMAGWPDEITIEDTTFTFEYAEVVGGTQERPFLNAEYV